MTTPYRQRIERAIGTQPPLLSARSKRAVVSALLAVPTALLALAITDNVAVPAWLRFAISPGWVVGLRFTRTEPCGGMLDCVMQVAHAVGRTAEIAWVVNAILYGFLIFGIVTTRASLQKRTR